MSTRLTKSPRAGHDLVDSRTLRLVFQLGGFRDRLIGWLLQRLHEHGFAELTAKQLTFMGELDCGANHAAELARRMGVSRQAIHKSVVELVALGWLETVEDQDHGTRKVIEFTEEGERLMACARRHFAALDEVLSTRFGEDDLERLSRLLDTDLS